MDTQTSSRSFYCTPLVRHVDPLRSFHLPLDRRWLEYNSRGACRNNMSSGRMPLHGNVQNEQRSGHGPSCLGRLKSLVKATTFRVPFLSLLPQHALQFPCLFVYFKRVCTTITTTPPTNYSYLLGPQHYITFSIQ